MKEFFWVIATTLSGIVALFGLADFASTKRISGPTAPLEGVITGIALIISLASLIVFICCIIFRPKAKLEPTSGTAQMQDQAPIKSQNESEPGDIESLSIATDDGMPLPGQDGAETLGENREQQRDRNNGRQSTEL